MIVWRLRAVIGAAHQRKNHRRKWNPPSLLSIFLKYFSQIGVILRDSHGVAQVRYITGNKILRILKAKGNFYRVSWILFFFLLVLVMKLWKLIVQHFIFLSGLAGTLPEDLYFLIKKAVAVRKHLEKHRKVCVIINFDINPFAPELPVQIHCHTDQKLVPLGHRDWIAQPANSVLV